MTVGLAAVFVTVIMLLSSGGGTGTLADAAHSILAAPHVATHVPPTSSSAIGAAWASISSGHGPAKPGQVACPTGFNCKGQVAPLVVPTASAKTWLDISNLTVNPIQARGYFGLAYDAKDGYVVMFGGQASNGTLGDTWIFVNGSWTQLKITGPPARYFHMMDYDAGDGYVLVFGGTVKGNPANDTWSFSGGVWTNRTNSVAPKPRIASAMAYDYKDGYMVLFGGTDPSSFFDFNDTWTYHATVWTKLGKANKLLFPREVVTMAWDNESHTIVLFGGYAQAKLNPVLSDTWNFTAGNWTKVNSSTFPPARFGQAMMFEPALGHLILGFGTNVAGNFLKDIWQYSLGVWTKLNTTAAPVVRSNTGMVWDSAEGFGVLFGGAGGTQFLNDTWSIGTDLEATVTLIPGSIDVGQSVLFRTAAVGNNSSYYIRNYFGLPAGCTNSNTSRLICAPSFNGSFPIIVNVTDQQGVKVTINVTLPVKGPPLVTGFTITPSAITLGQNFTATATAIGGVGQLNYAYTGLPGGCLSRNVSNFTCIPRVPSINLPFTYHINVTAKDALGGKSVGTADLTLNPDPFIANFHPSFPVLDLTQSTTLLVNASGGTGGLTYSYLGLPPGCPSVNTPSLSCTPGAAGNFSILVTVTDQASYSTNKTTNLLVNPSLTIATFNASPAAIDVGQTTTFSVNASGGTGLIVYTYSALPPGCQGTNFSFVNCAPNAAGTYQVGVDVTDTVNGSIQATATLIVSGIPAISAFSASPPHLDLGQSVTLTAAISGGTGTLNYSYTGLPAGCVAAASPTITCTPTATGVFSVHLSVRDGTGRAASSIAQLVISADPAIRSFVVSPAVVDLGSAVTFTTIVGAGTGPATYNYTGLPAGCPTANASENTSSLTCTPTAAGTYHISVTATDSARYSATATTNLTVNRTNGGPIGTDNTKSPLNLELIIVLLVIVAAAVIAGLLLWRRRSGGTGESGDEETVEDDGTMVEDDGGPPETVYGSEPVNESIAEAEAE